MTRKFSASPVFLLLMALAGCAPQSPAPAPVPAPVVNLSGYPPGFRQGYADGCASARPGAARSRDEARYGSDPHYSLGWRDGHAICGQRK